jgi:hypothetical protein
MSFRMIPIATNIIKSYIANGVGAPLIILYYKYPVVGKMLIYDIYRKIIIVC